MKKQRKQYAAEEQVAILRRHLLEKEPISKLCHPHVAAGAELNFRIGDHLLGANTPSSPIPKSRPLGLGSRLTNQELGAFFVAASLSARNHEDLTSHFRTPLPVTEL